MKTTQTPPPSFEERYEALRALGLDDISAYRDAMPETFASAMLGAALYALRSYDTASKALAMVQAHEHAVITAASNESPADRMTAAALDAHNVSVAVLRAQAGLGKGEA